MCKMLSSAVRLKVIHYLGEEEKSVGELARLCEVPQATLSQHLALMRQRGMLLTRKEGTSIYYRLANPKMLKAYNLMREILSERLLEMEKLSKALGRRTGRQWYGLRKGLAKLIGKYWKWTLRWLLGTFLLLNPISCLLGRDLTNPPRDRFNLEQPGYWRFACHTVLSIWDPRRIWKANRAFQSFWIKMISTKF